MPYIIQGGTYVDNALGGSPDHYNNEVFVPLEGMVEVLGGEVSFDGATATVTLNNVVARLVISQAEVQIMHGSAPVNITLSSEPILSADLCNQDQVMCVPLSFFHQAYSISVAYEVDTNTVSVD